MEDDAILKGWDLREEGEVDELKEEIKDLKKELIQMWFLEKDLNESNERVYILTDELVDAKTDIIDLEARCEELEKNKGSENKIAFLEGEADCIKEELISLYKKITNLTKENQRLQEENDRLNGGIANLKEQKDAIRRENITLKNQIFNIEVAKRELEANKNRQINSLKSKCEELEGKIWNYKNNR